MSTAESGEAATANTESNTSIVATIDPQPGLQAPNSNSPAAAEEGQGGSWWDNVRTAATVTGSFISTKATEAAVAAQPHVTKAGDYISTKAGDAAVATKEGAANAAAGAQLHMTAAGGYISSKAGETAVATKDGAINAVQVAATTASQATVVAGAYVQSTASHVATGLSTRVETAKAAKKMLDEGGQEVEDRLLAKVLGTEAVTAEKEAIASMKVASEKLRDAEIQLRCESEKLQTAASESSDSTKFKELADAYSARAKKLEELVELIAASEIEAPSLTEVEIDAIRLLRTKRALVGTETTEQPQSNADVLPDDALQE